MTAKELVKHINKTDFENAQQVLNEMHALLDGGKRFEFDWVNGYAPSVVAQFTKGDVSDCYITAIYVIKGIIHVDLHAYYLNDDASEISLGNLLLNSLDLADILEYMLEQ